MAATVQSLRDILFNVKSPIDLINRSTETTIMNQACQDIYNHLSKENVKQFFQLFLESMEPSADEVYPNIFVGNYRSILSVDHLHSKGITHVLNLGEADPLGVAPNINPQTLPGIKYNKLDMSDCVENSDEQIQIKAFKEAADIIDRILEDESAKLLVNCFAGVSRSASSVITYLILKKGMTAEEALKTLKQKRDVWPSNPNLKFLAEISNEKQGLQNVEEKDLGEIQLRILMKS